MTGQLKGQLSDAEKKEQSRAKANLIVNVTEDILVYMEDNNISKADLSRKLGKSKSYISGLFNNQRNITLNTLSDICFAVNLKPEVILVDKNNNATNYNMTRHAFIKTPGVLKRSDWREDDNRNSLDYSYASRTIKKSRFKREGYNYGY